MRLESRLSAWVQVFVLAFPPVSAYAGLPAASPERVGFDADRLQRIDKAIDRAIERGQVPGAVVLVGRRGAIAYARAAGKRAVEPKPEAMTRDTIFDMASLTKPIATATAVTILIDEGRLRLSDHFTSTLKEWNNHGKASVTIEQLLRHRAGFVADNPIADYQNGADTAWSKLAELELISRPARCSAIPM